MEFILIVIGAHFLAYVACVLVIRGKSETSRRIKHSNMSSLR